MFAASCLQASLLIFVLSASLHHSYRGMSRFLRYSTSRLCNEADFASDRGSSNTTFGPNWVMSALDRETAAAVAGVGEARRELALAQTDLAAQKQAAAERQKRFTVLSSTFKRKEEGFASQLAAARREAAAARADMLAAQRTVEAARQVRAAPLALKLRPSVAACVPAAVHVDNGTKVDVHCWV